MLSANPVLKTKIGVYKLYESRDSSVGIELG
jgi:hypothetical protein